MNGKSARALELSNGILNIDRFMDSVKWVDTTYYAKHKGEDVSALRKAYYPNLRMYSKRGTRSSSEALTMFLVRFGKKASISLLAYALSYVPVLGPVVLPAATFWSISQVAGLGPAAIVFGTGIFLPRRYLVILLQAYFSSRSLMRELVSHLLMYDASITY